MKEPDVPYIIFKELSSSLNVFPVLGMDLKIYKRTLKNLMKFIESGAPVAMVVPGALLDSEQQEVFRQYFCKKAKEDRCNYVYFLGPVDIQHL